MKGRKTRVGKTPEGVLGLLSGVAWYERDQWVRLKQVVDDPDELDETYEEWVKNAERAIQNITAQGVAIRKVNVDVEELIAWCRAEERPIDGAARAAFAGHRLREEQPSD